MSTLILVRHGQSAWNLENRFTGWYDVDLSPQGEAEAHAAAKLLAEEDLAVDVAYTSVLTRAIRTLHLILEDLNRLWIPVHRHWRLNERHYGGLTGLDKAETRDRYGEKQFMIWRRSYDVSPPPIEPGSAFDPGSDPRYAQVPPEAIPATECLADVVTRFVPYWQDVISTDLALGRTVLVAAHGNSIRALVKHLDRVPDDEIVKLEIPTGVPIVYELDEAMRPATPGGRWLGDPEVIAAAAEAVRRQGQRA